MASEAEPLSRHPVGNHAAVFRHVLAALAGCAVVLVLLILQLFPLAGVPRDLKWFRMVEWFLPFPLLAVPILVFIRWRQVRAWWPYAAAAAFVAVAMMFVPDIPTPSDWSYAFFGALRRGVLGSTAGLVFWAVARPASTVSPAPPSRVGLWSGRLGMAVYLIYLSLLLVVTLYGGGQELFGWPDVFGLYGPRVD
jgi:hypothetical protein